jgi:hypothetical protein
MNSGEDELNTKDTPFRDRDPSLKVRRWFHFGLAVVVSSVFAFFFATAMDQAVRNTPEFALRDFTQVWRGANALERGDDPWRPLDQTGLAYPYNDRVAYPLPALLLGTTVNQWPLPAIAAVFAGLSALLFGIAIGRRNTWHVTALASWQYFGVAKLLQWSGFMTAAARWDWAVPLVLCKPNLGLAVLAYHPSVRRLTIVAVFGIATLLVDPGWIFRWREATASMSYYVPPVLIWQAGGPLLLLSALRWKLPEGRLLLALTLIPHNLLFYDQLLLFLVCRRGRETMALVLLGWFGGMLCAYFYPTFGGAETAAIQANYRVPVVALLYLPALVMVLRMKQPDQFRMKPDEDSTAKLSW